MDVPVPNLFFLLAVAFLYLPTKLAFGNNINLSSTLSTDDKNPQWLSSSGEFAFGFRQLNNSNLFLLGIWYNQIPDKTIVWSANGDKPAPKGSKVQITESGLSLSNPQGEAIWRGEAAESVFNGAMLDTGNFVLASSDSTYVWQSFNNPTDTLLPTQILEQNGTLSSRLTQNNYTRGRFELYFLDNNLSLHPIGWPSESRYKSYQDIDASGSASRLVFNESGYIYVERKNGSKVPLWNNPALDSTAYYYRATLDFYGVLTQYAYARDSNIDQQGWTIVQYVPDNICTPIFDMGSGACGYNSYCSMENRRPTCKCPEGYSLVDPSNKFGGCQPEISLGCGADDEESQQRPEEVYEFKVLQQVNFPFGDYDKLENQTQQDCQKSCLYDCMCGVAIFSAGNCWKKKLPLSNGRADVNELGRTLIRTRVRPLGPSGCGATKADTAKPILLGSLIGSLVINSLLLATVILVVLFKNKKIVQASGTLLETNLVQASGTLLETNLHSFTYEALKGATNGFNEEIGRGSFGIVYKGTLGSGSTNIVAVKKLDRLAQEREMEFKTELGAIGKTCHKNLVRLIGFCDEGVHRLLVYDFMSNGTLADIVFGKSKLVWNLRVKIAVEIARGLVYLHEECDTPIIHCDIKPQNILIDEHFRAKISDFGLAKLLLSDQSRTQTMIRGTRGYVAPEWFKNVPVTAKVDVYSFGVMLLEIICCRRSVVLMDQSGEEEKAVLTDWAYDCYMEGRIDALVEDDREAMADMGRLQKWLMIAMWCIQEHPDIRPTMKMVMQMLDGFVDVPTPPSPSSFNSTS